MKIIFALLIAIPTGIECLAQPKPFDKQLLLDTCKKFGTLHGNEIKRWAFEKKRNSGLNDDLFGEILPKSTSSNSKIIISRAELYYFLNRDGIKFQAQGNPVSNPADFENKFGKQIQTIELDKPLYALVIKHDKLVKVGLMKLEGITYYTAYPHGNLDVKDKTMIPIVYDLDSQFDLGSPVLLVTQKFITQVDIEKAQITKNTMQFGTKDFPGILYVIGIDFNADGQTEVLMYHEHVVDKVTDEGDKGSSYQASIIGLFIRNKWYRTSYWENGQDGLEGF